MKRHAITFIAILISILFVLSGLTLADEEAFDTRAAAAHIEKGMSLLKSKKYDEAIAEFDKAASILPEAEPFYLLGYAYYMKGKTGDEDSRKKAMENFEKAYELDPNYTPAKGLPAIEPSPKTTTKQEVIKEDNNTTGQTGAAGQK